MLVEMINSVKQIHDMFWSNSSLTIVYIICFILLFTYFKQNKRAKDSLGTFSILIMVFIAYNPIISYILLHCFIDDVGVPIRIFLLIPFYAVLGYVFTELVLSTSSRKKQAIITIVLLTLIAVSGKSFYENGDFKITSNIYKIDQEVVDVNNILIADFVSQDDIYILMQTDGVPFIEYWQRRDDNLSEGLRQFNSQIKFVNEFYSMASYEQEGINGLENYVESLQSVNYRYIITTKNDVFVEDMKSIGFLHVGSTNNYEIFKRMDIE